MKLLIVTGDDFGLSIPVNEAIERGYSEGILSSASLMVGAEAASDAVERARRLPGLRVGLHLVLVRGRPVLPARDIPDLVDPNGEFSSSLIRSGFRFFFSRSVRRQLEAEIRAQFQAFDNTGLALDHVNAHNHMHLHPTVFNLLVKVGREYGLRAVRVPYEPIVPSLRKSSDGWLRRLIGTPGLNLLCRLMRRRLRQARLLNNDYLFGMHDTGQMTSTVVMRLISNLPDGVSEMYFHPALRSTQASPSFPPHYASDAEFAALISPEVRDALCQLGIERTTYSELQPSTP